MITVTTVGSTGWMVNMDVPERNVVAKIATVYSISKEAAMTAIINRGMDSIGKSITKAGDPRESHGCPHSDD